MPCYGWRFVYANGMIGENNQLIHTGVDSHSLDLRSQFMGSPDCFHQALQMQHICKDSRTSSELFLFVHASVLSTLFEKAGFPIHFVFAIAGVTNSRKTSLTLALAKIFNRKRLNADAEFATATMNGIEKALGQYHDGVVIVDDLKPSNDRYQQKTLENKLDLLLRFYGNRVAKKRMLDFCNSDKKWFPISGCCVITMEAVNAVLSSLSRMFISEIGIDTIDNKKLAFFQENYWILPTHIFDFLRWVTPKFEQIVDIIRKIFPQFRSKHEFAFPRFNEMYATFMTTAHILCSYATEKKFWLENDCSLFSMRIESLLCNEFAVMADRLKQSDKAIIALNALQEALMHKRLKPTQLNEQSGSLRNDCYEDDNFIFIRTRALLILVNNYCREGFNAVDISNENELICLLERLKALDIKYTPSGRKEAARKLPRPKGNTLRYLFIRKKIIFAYDA